MKRNFLLIILLQLVVSCAPLSQVPKDNNVLAYLPRTTDQSLLSRFHPVFLIEKHHKLFNRIGTPKAAQLENGEERIYVDPSEATVYTEKREFKTTNGTYTNLIYRIHFPETPFGLFPFQIGMGNNVGLIVIITLNSSELPVLYTTVHTCGCYLAFIPTTYLPENNYPQEWPENTQVIYSKILPSLLNHQKETTKNSHLKVMIEDASNRIINLWLSDNTSPKAYITKPIKTQPLTSLEKLPLIGSNSMTSFYETTGERTGYVKGSHKILERLLISWWAFDWKVGEDKKLSADKNDPPVFYTSLKPWARDKSDLRDFPAFLLYWGWNL